MKKSEIKAPASEVVQSETKFNLKLGTNTYTLNFGTRTFMRIKEARPSLSTAFHVTDELEAYEAIPFLIDCAIKPEDKEWSNFDELLDLYDECDDSAVAKVIPAYLSAAGYQLKKLTPAIEAIKAMSAAKKSE
jgi:hypothetical protein